MKKKMRSVQCVENAYQELGIQYEIDEDNPNAFITGIALENIEGFTFIVQCEGDHHIYMFAILATDIPEEKAEAIIDLIGEINLNLRFFGLYLDDHNNLILSYSYFMVESLQESQHQLISLMNSAMVAIDEFIPDVLTQIYKKEEE